VNEALGSQCLRLVSHLVGCARSRQGDWRLHFARWLCALCWFRAWCGWWVWRRGALVLEGALWGWARSRQGDWRLHFARRLKSLDKQPKRRSYRRMRAAQPERSVIIRALVIQSEM